MKTTVAKLSFVAVLSGLLSGCVFSTDRIVLNYPMRGARDQVAGADAVKVRVTLNDNRKVRDRVGRKGVGDHGVGKIVSTTDVAELVRGAIETELTRRGFAAGDGVLVECDLNEFYNRFKMGFWAGDSIADVEFKVQVKNHDGKVYFSKTVTDEGTEGAIQAAVGHNAKPALEQALQKAVTDLFADPAFTPSLLAAASGNPAAARN